MAAEHRHSPPRDLRTVAIDSLKSLVEIQLELHTEFTRPTRISLVDTSQCRVETTHAVELVGQVRAIECRAPGIVRIGVLQTTAEQAIRLALAGTGIPEAQIQNGLKIVNETVVKPRHEPAAIIEVAVPLQANVVRKFWCEIEFHSRLELRRNCVADIGIFRVKNAKAEVDPEVIVCAERAFELKTVKLGETGVVASKLAL